MQNAGLDEAQAGINIARRNINSLRYADDTTLTVELKRNWRGTKEPLDEGVRGEWKSWLKTQHSKNEDHGIWSLTSWQIDGETMETVTHFIFFGSRITANIDCSHEIKNTCSLEEKLWQTRQQIKKQRHYFSVNCSSSQGYPFSSIHIWLWDLNHKEG